LTANKDDIMNRGLVLLLLAGCTGEPGETTTDPPPEENTAPAPHCATLSDESVGWDDPVLDGSPSAFFEIGTGLFAGELTRGDELLAVTLDVDPNLGEIRYITREWQGEDPAPPGCHSTVEVSFAARFSTDDAEIDAAFTAAMVADGAAVGFQAALPPTCVSSDALPGASVAEEMSIAADLDPSGAWSGWLTWGDGTEDAAWFEVVATPR
jgi:hypothetical protein